MALSLSKGQNLSLSKTDPGLKKIIIGLGWDPRATDGQEFDLDAFLMNLIRRLHARLLSSSSEAAHLKVIGLCDGSYAVANLVSNATGPELSLASNSGTRTANVVVNARVATDPAELEVIVREEVAAASAAMGISQKVISLQSFRPGRPVPTHRINSL